MNSKFLLKIASCLVLAAGMLAVSCSNDESVVPIEAE